MRIIMIRHPVTKANIEGLIQDRIDGRLDTHGYKQLEKLIKRLEREPIDKIYSSDAYRCKILAERIAQLKHLEVFYSYLFREIDNGELFNKKKEDVSRLNLQDPENYRPQNGESIYDLANRAKEGLDVIKQDNGKRIVLISHGWFLKVFLGNQIGMSPLPAIKYLKFSNCALSEISLEKDTCMVEYLNNRDYLK